MKRIALLIALLPLPAIAGPVASVDEGTIFCLKPTDFDLYDGVVTSDRFASFDKAKRERIQVETLNRLVSCGAANGTELIDVVKQYKNVTYGKFNGVDVFLYSSGVHY